MSTILILGGTALLATALIVLYYRTVGTKRTKPKNFGNDGQLHLIYPE